MKNEIKIIIILSCIIILLAGIIISGIINTTKISGENTDLISRNTEINGLLVSVRTGQEKRIAELESNIKTERRRLEIEKEIALEEKRLYNRERERIEKEGSIISRLEESECDYRKSLEIIKASGKEIEKEITNILD